MVLETVEFGSSKDDFTLSFKSVVTPNARIVNGRIFPLVLKVYATDTSNRDKISELLFEISQSGKFTELLNDYGAVLLRGLNDNSSIAFSKYITAIESGRGNTPFEQIGLAGKRFEQALNVFTANEGPQTTRFYQHNEYARYTHFPSNIHFFSNKAPSNGGESPIAHSNEFFNRVKDEIPEFIDELSRKGLISVQVYPSKTKVTTATKGNEFFWEGSDSFGQEIDFENDTFELKKQKAEKQIKRLTSDFKWLDDGSLIVRQHVPAFRTHPVRKFPTFFNGLNGRYGTSRDNDALNPPYNGKNGGIFLPSTYDNSEVIPLQYLEIVNRISMEIEYNHKWQEGDLLLVDNYQVSHGRAPWFGDEERVVLVSMWDNLKLEKPEPYSSVV